MYVCMYVQYAYVEPSLANVVTDQYHYAAISLTFHS